MNKTKISSIIMLLLLSFSLVSAYVGTDNIPTYEDLLQENVMLKKQLTQQRMNFNQDFLNFANKCIIRDPLKSYISFDRTMTIEELINPVIVKRGGTRTITNTITNTETEYVHCEECVWRGCRIPTEYQVGTTEPDSCGCTYAICEDVINPIPPHPNPVLVPVPSLAIK
jgi:hypothetical protein